MFQNSFQNEAPVLAPPQPLLPLRVGLIGTGVVGSGVCQVLAQNADVLTQRAGRAIRVHMAAARNLAKAQQVVGPEVVLLSDPLALVRHPDIDVVVEAMGGVDLAKDLVLQAIAHGKHVVTANKALLAEHGGAIFAAAEAQGVIVAYEGAVAVSIPIVKALREGLAANRISAVVGIVNGTTNFILSQMQSGGLDFQTALGQARELGYAEADPRLDVEGMDAAHKTALLAAIAFGAEVPFADIYTQGITQITPWDMACAQALGFRIKLLGVSRQMPAALDVRVHPAWVPEGHLLAQVHGVMNGIWVQADAAGPTFHYGAGAGACTTASAVIADLVDVARRMGAGVGTHVPHRSVQPQAVRRWPLLPMGQVVSRHGLRFVCQSGAHLLTNAQSLLAASGIAVEQLAWVPKPAQDAERALAVLTGPLSGEALTACLAGLAHQAGYAPAAVWRVVDGLDDGLDDGLSDGPRKGLSDGAAPVASVGGL